MDTPDPAAEPVPDAIPAPDEPSPEEQQEAKGRADSMEQLMIEVQADEANWVLDDRLDFLLKTG